jgi:hypothetical protein
VQVFHSFRVKSYRFNYRTYIRIINWGKRSEVVVKATVEKDFEEGTIVGEKGTDFLQVK